MQKFPVQLVVEPSQGRCFADGEFLQHQIDMSENLHDCDILLGVKEIPVQYLLPGKTYFIFSHTIKKQPHNRKLLQAVLEKNIRLIDYEVLKDEKGNRLIAFGRFAGMVGAHNALWTYGERTGFFSLKRMKDHHDYQEAKQFYRTVKFPALKIVLTGTGRVGSGAAEVLHDMGIEMVTPHDFLHQNHTQAVFTQLDCRHYAAKKDGGHFEKRDYYRHPDHYKSVFAPFYRKADIMINGIFWDSRAPAFFTLKEMSQPDFNLQVIADVTCDIAPNSSVPSTIRASSIQNPVYGFDPHTQTETKPFQPGMIDVMAIDNLPNEMPRDASTTFGELFIRHILPELLLENSPVIEHATIAEGGSLTKHFRYLEDYAYELHTDLSQVL
jgi:alanine dehydrogenase